MENFVKYIFSLILLFAFFSCASTKNFVYITNAKKTPLLNPLELEEDIDSLFLFEGNFGEKKLTFICLLQIDKGGILVSLLNELGVGIGNISFDGKNIFVSSAVLPKDFKAQYIIADIQNAFYKEESVRKNLEASHLFFEVVQNENIQMRRIMSDKKCVQEIFRSKKSIEFHNYLRGYNYKITEFDDE